MVPDAGSSEQIHWDCQPFSELSSYELHELLRLRVDVFVVEQRCPYPEVDGKDPESLHLLGRRGGDLVAYARWYPEGDAVRLGRIVLHPTARGGAVGRDLMDEALRRIGSNRVVIGAQQPLEAFYGRFGFHTVHGPYDDYGIPHLDMVREPSDDLSIGAGERPAPIVD